MKITYIDETIDLETYCGDDLNHFILDTVNDLAIAATYNRDGDYDKAYNAIEEALDYIIHRRRNQ